MLRYLVLIVSAFTVALMHSHYGFTASAATVPKAEVVGGTRSDEWSVYGATTQHHRVSGGYSGNALTVTAPQDGTEPWSSAASIPISAPLQAGDVITAVFWARAEQPTKIDALMGGTAPPYTSFAKSEVPLSPNWQRHLLSGRILAEAGAGSHMFTLHLGRTGTAVQLGRAVLLRGSPSQAQIAAAFAEPEPTIEDVSFDGPDGAMLAGTLRVPPGVGPFPITIMIGGSGPQKRGGFRLLNAPLLANGIATFEYDKRGSGKSGGTFVESVPVLVGDLQAAVAMLRKRHEIDPRRVALLGGSQGGAVAPAVAVGDPLIRGVVMLAGPTLPGEHLFKRQLLSQIDASTSDPVHKKRSAQLVDQILPVLRDTADDNMRQSRLERILKGAATQGAIPVEDAGALAAVLAAQTMRDTFSVQPEPVLRKLRTPVLALFAENDSAVPSHEHLPAARKALSEHLDATVIEIAGVNHLFQPGGASLADLAKPTGLPYSAPEIRELVVPWLVNHLSP